MTVAGDAYARSRISKMRRMCASTLMRSFEGRVSVLLSSMTEFMFSIQLASRSPSRMSHFGPCDGSALAISRMVHESKPSFQSRVARLTKP